MSPGSPQLDTDKWWKRGGEDGGKAGGKVNLLSFYGGGKVGGKGGGKVLRNGRKGKKRRRREKKIARAHLCLSIYIFLSPWLGTSVR